MNERIKELAIEAGYSMDMQQHQKFAELLIRECARIARNTDLEDVEGGDSAVLRAASEQIEQHFGVEE